MPKRKNPAKEVKNPLDALLKKRGRGRPGVRRSEVRGRSDNYRFVLGQIWEDVGGPLLKAQTEQDVIRALDLRATYGNEFKPFAALILKVLHERRFPKRRQPRINFLADSLAGVGRISARRARDICDLERAKEERKSKHKIIRREYYIECSCGYKGPARDNACQKCGAEIPPSFGSTTGLLLR